MAKHSNNVRRDSSDGLPDNPYPLKVAPTMCIECGCMTTEAECPECGAEMELDFEPDYEAGDQEYEPDND